MFLGASPAQPAPCELRQGRKAAAVAGRSGVMQVACPLFLFLPFFSSAPCLITLYCF